MTSFSSTLTEGPICQRPDQYRHKEEDYDVFEYSKNLRSTKLSRYIFSEEEYVDWFVGTLVTSKSHRRMFDHMPPLVQESLSS